MGYWLIKILYVFSYIYFFRQRKDGFLKHVSSILLIAPFTVKHGCNSFKMILVQKLLCTVLLPCFNCSATSACMVKLVSVFIYWLPDGAKCNSFCDFF